MIRLVQALIVLAAVVIGPVYAWGRDAGWWR